MATAVSSTPSKYSGKTVQTLSDGTKVRVKTGTTKSGSGSRHSIDTSDPASVASERFDLSRAATPMTDVPGQQQPIAQPSPIAPAVPDQRTQATDYLRQQGYSNPDETEIQGAMGKFNPNIGTTPPPQSLPEPNRFQQGLANANASGLPAPADQGKGRAGVASFVAPPPQPTVADKLYQSEPKVDNPYFADLQKAAQDYLSPKKQRESLTQEYKKLVKTSGIDELNTELMNMKNVIDGSEDDIRNEITKAGGFATESQISALTNSRNKQLIKNYNNLLEAKNSKEEYINTLIGLSKDDRDAADRDFDTKMNLGFKMVEYQQKMQDNAKESYQKIVDKIGYAGLNTMTAGDPYYTKLVESTLGLAPGGLAQLSTIKDTEQELDLAIKRTNLAKAQIDLKNAQTSGVTGSDAPLYQGLSSPTATAVRATVSGFKTEPQVKNFTQIQDARNYAGSLSNTTKNPSDDQALIYAFAKTMDPDSVVREGEYATVQKYAQSLTDAYGKSVSQAINGTGFLTEGARKNIKDTIEAKYKSSKMTYDNVRKQYVGEINNLTGRDDGEKFVRDYSSGGNIVTAPDGNDYEIID